MSKSIASIPSPKLTSEQLAVLGLTQADLENPTWPRGQELTATQPSRLLWSLIGSVILSLALILAFYVFYLRQPETRLAVPKVTETLAASPIPTVMASPSPTFPPSDPITVITLTLSSASVQRGDIFTVSLAAKTQNGNNVPDGTQVTLFAEPANVITFTANTVVLMSGGAGEAVATTESVTTETTVKIIASILEGDQELTTEQELVIRPPVETCPPVPSLPSHKIIKIGKLYGSDPNTIIVNQYLFELPSSTPLYISNPISGHSHWEADLKVWLLASSFDEKDEKSGEGKMVQTKDGFGKVFTDDPAISGQEVAFGPLAEGYDQARLICRKGDYDLVTVTGRVIKDDVEPATP